MSNFLHFLITSHPEACRAYFYGALPILAISFVYLLAEGSGLIEEIFGDGLSFWMVMLSVTIVAALWPVFVAYYALKIVFIALFMGGTR